MLTHCYITRRHPFLKRPLYLLSILCCYIPLPIIRINSFHFFFPFLGRTPISLELHSLSYHHTKIDPSRFVDFVPAYLACLDRGMLCTTRRKTHSHPQLMPRNLE